MAPGGRDRRQASAGNRAPAEGPVRRLSDAPATRARRHRQYGRRRPHRGRDGAAQLVLIQADVSRRPHRVFTGHVYSSRGFPAAMARHS